MQIRYNPFLAIAIALALVASQPLAFAGAFSKPYIGKIRYFQPRLKIKQPAPIQAAANVNVRDFGATGNGSTDDTAAIQNAIAAAKATGQGVLFPAGTYLHASRIVANGVALIGVGAASVLVANNPSSSSVILQGVSPSLQNMIVNSEPAGGGGFTSDPNRATVAVQDSQNFVVQGASIVQGTGRPGVNLIQSAVGQVSGVTFYGHGSGSDIGIAFASCANVSFIGNVFVNEGSGISSLFNGLKNTSIAVISNTVSASSLGMALNDVNVLHVEQNQITLGAGASFGITLGNGQNFLVTNNTVTGSTLVGITVATVTDGTGQVTQNTIRNCGSQGLAGICGPGNSSVRLIGNQLGECGITTSQPAILCAPNGPDSIIVLNNVYAGHNNNLTAFITSTAHLNYVSGNVQTQSLLPNNIP